MLIALPVLIPMLGALCLLFWGRSRPQAVLALASTASMLAASVWILFDVRDGTILTLNFEAGRHRSGSRSWPIYSVRSW